MIRRPLLAAGLALLAALLIAPRATLADDPAPPTVATVAALEGQAFLLRQGRQIPMKHGMAVADGDEVLTFPDGRVRLRFTDGALVTFGPDSRCEVRFHRRDAEHPGQFLQLVEGILRLLTDQSGPDRLEVRTRSAIAVPRGTDWIVERKPGSTAVFVASGEVAVSGAGETVTLDAGEGTDVPDGQPPSPAKRWGKDRVDDALARTRLP
ncbi:FecR family protein [Tistlia consotensis]|uniref:FecR family protein n=1 Tax=Tistlia consotensis USBA 355 TaxID=560819 RepID=A0A1Y6B6Y5_9PROT|nr:FecR domain-containing protein [Tistlia consotensis]SME87803.1 FecR family protein [Tistlia consotensis USBA 355]SNR24164.1 FecR family protein [Tistlia consotensis]